MKRETNLIERMQLQILITAAVLAIGLCAPGLTSAQEICAGVVGRRATYLPITGRLFTNALDSRTDPTDPKHEVKLRGTLHYRIDGEPLKDRPALIFNHGHEQARGEACAIVEFFTLKGWVVLTPLRRGHFLKAEPSFRSTGIYIDDFVNACSRSQSDAESPPYYLTHLYRGSGFCRPEVPLDNPAARRSAVELDYLGQQRFEVRDTITYMKALAAIGTSGRLVDPQRVAILGHSYGGALTVMTNAHDYGQSVAIDIAGAELSWANDDEPYWAIDLKAAMREQKRPIFLFQAQNGKYLAPTKALFSIGVNKEFIVQAAIFPPAPACSDANSDGLCDNDTTQTVFKDIHGNFISASEVPGWGNAVINFANRNQR